MIHKIKNTQSEAPFFADWDAQNKNSVALAEKLGYHYSHTYTAYEVAMQYKNIGAVWVRIMDDYGHVEDGVHIDYLYVIGIYIMTSF